MKNLRLIALGTSSLLVAAAAVLAACSSEDTVVSPVDSGTDAPADVTTKPDTGPEPADAASEDSAPPFDGGTESFTQKLADALCKAAARCCFGDATLQQDAGVDGGSFQLAKCKGIYQDTGFEGSLHGINAVDSGLLTLDPQAAGDCLQGAENIACNVQGADLAALRTKCFNAFYSTAAAGTACSNSAGCGKGLFCNTAVDGGTCQALRGDGGACGDWTTNKSLIDEACTWRGMGGDQFCQFYQDFNSGNELDAGEYFCQPASGTGGPCINDAWCKAGICDTLGNNPTYSCQTPAILFPPAGLCTAIATP